MKVKLEIKFKDMDSLKFDLIQLSKLSMDYGIELEVIVKGG